MSYQQGYQQLAQQTQPTQEQQKQGTSSMTIIGMFVVAVVLIVGGLIATGTITFGDVVDKTKNLADKTNIGVDAEKLKLLAVKQEEDEVNIATIKKGNEATAATAASVKEMISKYANNIIITDTGSVSIGNGNITPANASGGFLYIPGVASPPTGTPAAVGVGNTYPICFCNANNRLYIYNGGWVSSAFT